MARIFMKGTEAVAEAAVRAGCRFFAGYPITPQNEVPEYLARRLPEVGGVFVQGESEVASVNMVYGAASAGTRSMTSSSSPGISLKSEGISYCAAARIPMVYANFARGGPGVGSIQPAQQDYLQATKASGNGGFKMMKMSAERLKEFDNPPKLIAVTILTSIDQTEWKELGHASTIQEDVIRLAKLSQSAGLDGVVASPREAEIIRDACGNNFLIVTPGIRPAGTALNDQSRIATPAEAIKHGATHLVVGRPIRAAANPREAAEAILREIA